MAVPTVLAPAAVWALHASLELHNAVWCQKGPWVWLCDIRQNSHPECQHLEIWPHNATLGLTRLPLTCPELWPSSWLPGNIASLKWKYCLTVCCINTFNCQLSKNYGCESKWSCSGPQVFAAWTYHVGSTAQSIDIFPASHTWSNYPPQTRHMANARPKVPDLRLIQLGVVEMYYRD